MRPPSRRELTVVLALLLIAVPIWTPALDVTGVDYRYEVADLSTEDGKLVVDAPRGSYIEDVDGIDCFDRSSDFARRCFYDGGALDGNVTGVNPSIVRVTGYAGDELTRKARTDEYVMLGDEIYRRSTTFVAANESVGMTVELGVERVEPATALEDVARDEDRVSDAAKRAIREGSITTDEPIEDANEVLAVDGDYYVVYEDSRPGSLSEKPAVERTLEALSVAAGAWLLLRD
jgi:PAS domain-containing protein